MKRLYCRHFGGIEELPLSKDCMLQVAEDKIIFNTKYMFMYKRIRRFKFYDDSDGILNFEFHYPDKYNYERKYTFICTVQQMFSQWGKRKVLKQIKYNIDNAWRK